MTAVPRGDAGQVADGVEGDLGIIGAGLDAEVAVRAAGIERVSGEGGERSRAPTGDETRARSGRRRRARRASRRTPKVIVRREAWRPTASPVSSGGALGTSLSRPAGSPSVIRDAARGPRAKEVAHVLPALRDEVEGRRNGGDPARASRCPAWRGPKKGTTEPAPASSLAIAQLALGHDAAAEGERRAADASGSEQGPPRELRRRHQPGISLSRRRSPRPATAARPARRRRARARASARR